ncbi:hypothetical protein PAXRUDRAFT_20862 [Paxillus rubicundulus Ve08.2h10]|uniref:Uncharacterized protein n=1 Tax=Paxillus rubicundulus Ve08.2h10 TaxID=930991 RepID=A0A0D0CD50_9AGAM|nr:hypothetical protein PAXRUDRAFT_20862 [Paxillus rubicundulus Ve08.2h10]
MSSRAEAWGMEWGGGPARGRYTFMLPDGVTPTSLAVNATKGIFGLNLETEALAFFDGEGPGPKLGARFEGVTSGFDVARADGQAGPLEGPGDGAF